MVQILFTKSIHWIMLKVHKNLCQIFVHLAAFYNISEKFLKSSATADQIDVQHQFIPG